MGGLIKEHGEVEKDYEEAAKGGGGTHGTLRHLQEDGSYGSEGDRSANGQQATL